MAKAARKAINVGGRTVMASEGSGKTPLKNPGNSSGNKVFTTSSGARVKTSSQDKAESLSIKSANERVPTPVNVAPQAPVSPTVPSQALQPVTTPAAAPTTKQTAIQTSGQQGQSYQLRPGESFEQYNDRTSKYKQGLAAAQASGEAPQDAGVARSAVTAFTPDTPDTSATDALLSADPVTAQLMTGISDLLNSKNQTTSLMQDYKRLRRDSGLDDINEELIDAETVIDGTEDDIRNEIQVAGGMGTESQVQAMTLARNKGLLKRYNQLVQMKSDATNQLNTMLQLNVQDKQMAQQKIDSQISAMFNMANFRQTATQNARSQYQWLATQDPIGFYNSMAKDPRQMAMAEKILGTGAGGLKGFADQKIEEKRIIEEERQFARDVQSQQLAISRSSAANSAALGWANLAENKRQFNESQNETGAGNGQLLDLLGQYKTSLQGSNWWTRSTSPTKRAELDTLKAQITAEYKKAQQLGTLDAGVQTLIDQTLGTAGIASFNTGAQVKAIEIFESNQGGNPYANYKKALGM